MTEWSVPVPNDLSEELHSLLSAATAGEIEFLVSFSDGYKMEIFADEHPPPHFRVMYKGDSNTYRIDDCKPMHGDALRRHYRWIRTWHAKNRTRLIEVWNTTRPADCPVGVFRESSPSNRRRGP